MSATRKSIDDVLSDLNTQQRAAATHGNGPLLIVAGAGTGKTTTLAHRVANLIAGGADPARILLLTFTRRAAAEMLRRVDAILQRLGEKGASAGSTAARLATRKTWGGTFHSVATRLLRQHGRLIGLEAEFTILDRGDSEDLMNVLRGELNLPKSETRFPLKGTCLDIYSRCVNTQFELSRVLNESFPWCIDHAQLLKELFRNYVDRKESQAVLDYDDLLLFWNALVNDPEAGPTIRDKFDHVLVDEYQDTNTLQADIVRGLSPDGQGLTVVGDDAQSIYSFRAATVRNILDFPVQYDGTTIVTLEQNYRSTQPILEATNRVIAYASERHHKNLFSTRIDGMPPRLVQCLDEDEQTDFVIDRILEHREAGTALASQAVLFRASHHSLALEVELSRRNIPFHKYGGLKFIETAHVKDLLAFLRLAENPRDAIAGTRVLTMLPGIGHVKAQQLLDMLKAAQHCFQTWLTYSPPAATVPVWKEFVTLMQQLERAAAKSTGLSTQIGRARRFYAPLMEQRLDHAAARLRDLEQLEQVSNRFTDRATFLAEMTLDPPSSTQELSGDPLLDEDYLILSTIHSAKGLEWDSVFVIHAADGNIPSDMSTGSSDEIEEERRLFYVALTRARNHLYVCHPQRYYFHGRYRGDAHSYSQLTRFLPADVLEHFDKHSANANDSSETTEDAPTDLTTADIRRKIKTLWT